MTSDKASGIVFASGILVFGMGWFYNADHGKGLPPGKFLIGASVTFLGLEFLTDVNADLGAALAIAIATTAFFHYGGPLMSYINQTPTVKPPPRDPPKPAPSKPVHLAPHR